MIYVVGISGIVIGISITYLYYQYIPKIKNEYWVDGYNNGIRDFYKASKRAEELDKNLNWD